MNPQEKSQEQLIQELLEALPKFEETPNLGIEDQARAMLTLVLIKPNTPPQNPVKTENPTTCPNCGVPDNGTRTPYCSTECRDEAAFVRQLRHGLQLGTILDRERQIGMAQEFWHMLGGGYPLRVTLIPPNAIAKVIARDGGTCPECSEPATTVDHLKTACNRPINLRAVCETCTRDIPFGSKKVLGKSEIHQKIQRLAQRIHSPTPILACDNADTWDWRHYLKKRKASS
jgi:hypothetical protein